MQYQEALRINPGLASVHYDLGVSLERAAHVPEGIGHYEQALRIKPDYPKVQNNLAWLLATRPDVGDPVRAVTLARQACQLTDNRVASYLDTLAAAYAAAGRFDAAVATAQVAMDVGRSTGQVRLVEQIGVRLELYRRGRAYSQSTEVTSPSAP